MQVIPVHPAVYKDIVCRLFFEEKKMIMKINIISVPVSVVTEVHVYLEKADGVIFGLYPVRGELPVNLSWKI